MTLLEKAKLVKGREPDGKSEEKYDLLMAVFEGSVQACKASVALGARAGNAGGTLFPILMHGIRSGRLKVTKV